MRFKILLIAVFCFFLISCGNGKGGSSQAQKDIYSMKGLHLTQTDKGSVKFIIDAEEAQVYPKQKMIKGYKIRLKYFDKEKEASNLVSDKGSLNISSNDIDVSGNVVLKTKENAVLETESLVWSNTLGKLTSKEFVKITKGDNVMTGYGFESDMMLDDIVIKKPATKITDVNTLTPAKK